MTNTPHELLPVQTPALLLYYGFDLKGRSATWWVDRWTSCHSPYWVRLAIVEAIYQGRYKAISVAQILERWSQKGHPGFHFTHDFECLVCRNIPEDSALPSSSHPKLKSLNPPKVTATLTPLDRLFPERRKPIQFLPSAIASTAEPPIENPNTDSRGNGRQDRYSSPRQPPSSPSPSGIHRFVPHLDDSELYNKLRWIVHQELAHKLET